MSAPWKCPAGSGVFALLKVQGSSIYFFENRKPEDFLIIGLYTIICGGEDFADMDEFGRNCKDFLQKFPELWNGISDSDTFRRVFEKINPSELSACLLNWISVEHDRRRVVAADQKTICESKNTKHKLFQKIR